MVVAPGKTILVFNQYVGFRVNYWEVLNRKGKQMTFWKPEPWGDRLCSRSRCQSRARARVEGRFKAPTGMNVIIVMLLTFFLACPPLLSDFSLACTKSPVLTVPEALTPRLGTLPALVFFQTCIGFRRRINAKHFFTRDSVARLFLLKMKIKSYLEYWCRWKSRFIESGGGCSFPFRRRACPTPIFCPLGFTGSFNWLVFPEFTSGFQGK